MKHLAFAAAIFLAGACLDDPDDYSLGEESQEVYDTDGPATAGARCRELKSLWTTFEILSQETTCRMGSWGTAICMQRGLINDAQHAIAEEFRALGCVGPLKGGPFIP